MDLLKTLLVYMSLVFTTSVQTAPEPSYIPQDTPVPTAYVEVTPTPTPRPTPVPTINITPNPSYKTIQTGDNGDLVRAMQEKLAEYGYYDGEIDGRFGNQTRRAVEAFQYQHGLTSDGIAGRHTLTVLYESPEIRRAPEAEPTASATPEARLAPALTPEASAAAFVPVVTSIPAPTATPAPTKAPDAVISAELVPMDGWTIRVVDTSETVVGASDVKALVPAKADGELYLPLKEVLTAGYLNVISSSSIEAEEFAFAIGDRIIRIAYTEDQSGSPVNVEAFVNSEPQLMPLRDIREANGTIYLPASSIEMLTGLKWTADETAQTILIALPQFE